MRKTVGAALIVAGTATGAGMLALPVGTATLGLGASVALFCVCWGLMAGTGLLLAESCAWMPRDSNIVTLSHHLIGRWGKRTSWLLYLFLFISLMVAYSTGGGGLVSSLLGVSPVAGVAIFLALFAPVVIIGTHAIDKINTPVMAALLLSYLAFVIWGLPSVDTGRWSYVGIEGLGSALPLILTSFSFQGTVPSLMRYLDYDLGKMRIAIIAGSLVPLAIYIVWEALVLGLVPLETLVQAREAGSSAIIPLRQTLASGLVSTFGSVFAFLAILTSFWGVSLGLLDFLRDGLQWRRDTLKERVVLSLIVFVLPGTIALVWPNLFLAALTHAGGIGCAALLGIFPILMVWNGRYVQGRRLLSERCSGGKGVLLVVGAILVCEVIVDLLHLTGWLQ